MAVRPPKTRASVITPEGVKSSPDTSNSITEQPNMDPVPLDVTAFPLQESTAWAGTSIYGAVLNWPKYNPDALLSRQGPQIYDTMARDEQVKAVTKFKRDAILSRQWEFQWTADTDGIDQDEKDERTLVLTKMISSMKGSFADNMAFVLKAQRYGYSLTEKIFDMVEIAGKAWYAPIELRPKPPFTFYFKTDVFGALVEFGQNFGGILQPLDIRKFVHYVNEPDEDLWFGRSELYAAYRSWYSKDVLIKMQNLYAERMAGGFLTITREHGAQEPNRADLLALDSLLANVKTISGVRLPPGFHAEMVHPSGSEMFSSLIEYHDQAIAKALLVPNLFGISHQGHTGSYSQSQTQLETFFWTINADTARLEDTVNQQLIKEVCELNWGDKQYPEFKFKPASEEFVKWVVGQWAALIGANAVITTEADEAHLRKILNMPNRSDDDVPLVTPAQEQAASAGGGVGQSQESSATSSSGGGRSAPTDAGGAENMIRQLYARTEEPKGSGPDGWTAEKHLLHAGLHNAAARGIDAFDTDGNAARLHREAAKAHVDAAEAMYNGTANIAELSLRAVQTGEDAGSFSPTAIGKPAAVGDKRAGMAGYSRNHKPITCSKLAFSKASARVSFSVIAQKTEGLAAHHAKALAPLVAQAAWKVIKGAKEHMASPASIQDAKFSGTDIGKLNKACQSMLQDGWLLGQQHASKELVRAKAPGFSRLKFDALRGDAAAQFLEANGFRMAGNLTDGSKAIIQQELLNGVKSGANPEDVAATIFERLIDKGFTDLESAQGAVDDRDVTDALSQAFGTDSDEGTLSYLNTLTRTNMFEAMNEARYEAFTDPALDGFVQGLEYSAILDDRTTDICDSLNGAQYAADSEVWDTYRPPNHYNCRSILIPITTADGWDGTESDPPDVEPQDGFGAGEK